MTRRARVLLLFLLAACQAHRPQAPVAWPLVREARPAHAEHAMVVSEAPEATRTGVAVLAKGGNAVDAAVAVAFALAVVFPEAGNIGGGGFALVRTPAGEVTALDFREVAPLAASRDMYLDASGKATDESRHGPKASGVPGSVAGLFDLHRRHGSRPWAELVAPAIALAEDGYTVDEQRAASIDRAKKELARHPVSAATYLPGGVPLAAGARVRQPELAATLRRIAERGASGFYEGETAELIVAEMARTGGIITKADLAGYKPVWREPIGWAYRGYKLWSMPPPSSGGITLALLSNILAGYDLGKVGWGTPRHGHLLAEAMRRAFIDRNSYLGDPDFVKIPARLTAAEYGAERRKTIDEQRATPSTGVAPGLGEPDHTTHFAVVDRAGMAIGVTTTLNELFGSAVTVTGAGFVLNNEMDDFTAKVGAPNMFGLVQGPLNAIAPKKRMLSAMSPTIIAGADGKLFMVVGGRGGPRIISSTFQVLSNIIDFGMDAGTAVSLPRIHHQHSPDVIVFERGGLDVAQQDALRMMGHALKERPPGEPMSEVPVIVRDRGGWTACPDPRKGGLAEGL